MQMTHLKAFFFAFSRGCFHFFKIYCKILKYQNHKVTERRNRCSGKCDFVLNFFPLLLSDRVLHLRMFSQDQGSWVTMFFSTIFFLFLFSYVYNLLLLMGGDATIPYRISEYMGIRNSTFMKGAATGTWCGDLFTAWMVRISWELPYTYLSFLTRRSY